MLLLEIENISKVLLFKKFYSFFILMFYNEHILKRKSKVSLDWKFLSFILTEFLSYKIQGLERGK